MNDILARKLRLVVSPARFYPSSLDEDMGKAYLLWRHVWKQALAEEMNVRDELYSDNFTRQSHVAVIFYEDEPFVLTTLNVMDLEKQVYQDDSYFKVWTKSAQEKLLSHSKSIITCANLAMNFKFRKNVLGVSGKDLMFSVLVHYLKASAFDSMVAAVRLEKGMEKAAYRTGATCLESDLPYSIPGQRVDLVCWKRELDLALVDPEMCALSHYIWKNSSLIIDRHLLTGEKYAA